MYWLAMGSWLVWLGCLPAFEPVVSRRVRDSIANGIKVLSCPTAVVQKQVSLYSFLTGSCCFSDVDALFLFFHSFFFLSYLKLLSLPLVIKSQFVVIFIGMMRRKLNLTEWGISYLDESCLRDSSVLQFAENGSCDKMGKHKIILPCPVTQLLCTKPSGCFRQLSAASLFLCAFIYLLHFWELVIKKNWKFCGQRVINRREQWYKKILKKKSATCVCVYIYMYNYFFIEDPLFWLWWSKLFLGNPLVLQRSAVQCSILCLSPEMVCGGASLVCLVALYGARSESVLQEPCWVLFCASTCAVTPHVNACAVWSAPIAQAQEHPSHVRPTAHFPLSV